VNVVTRRRTPCETNCDCCGSLTPPSVVFIVGPWTCRPRSVHRVEGTPARSWQSPQLWFHLNLPPGAVVVVVPAGSLAAPEQARILGDAGAEPHRFATAPALIKHAGLAPREGLSGTFTGRTKLTGQGRPKLRLVAWRAVWGPLQTNNVYVARYRHLTTRDTNRLTPTHARPTRRPSSRPRSCGTCMR
jgi:Transposase IS116/IS110/IS902 family